MTHKARLSEVCCDGTVEVAAVGEGEDRTEAAAAARTRVDAAVEAVEAELGDPNT